MKIVGSIFLLVMLSAGSTTIFAAQPNGSNNGIKALVSQLSWDSVGGACNGIWRIFPAGEAARKLLRIGKPASDELFSVLEDESKGVAAHLILSEIWESEKVVYGSRVERDIQVHRFIHIYNGLEWADHINAKDLTLEYRVEQSNLILNAFNWRRKLDEYRRDAASPTKVFEQSSSSRTMADTAAMPSLTIAIDHVALSVVDLDASVAFYSGVFGLQEIPAAAKGRRWLSLGKGVALHLLGERSAPVADNRSVHLALTSDNLEPILQRLRERRIPWSDFAGKPGAISSGRSDGVRQIFLRDPDGYWIEVNDALKNTAK